MKKTKSGSVATYDVIVDSEKILTLSTGSQSEIDLPKGHHTLYFKQVGIGGIKSNELKINIGSSEEDILIEGGSTASIIPLESNQITTVVTCSCGAPNKVIRGIGKNCEYCGRPLDVPPTQEQTQQSQINERIGQQQAQQTAQTTFKSEKPKKPWYKRPWVWIIIFFIVMGVYNSIGVGLRSQGIYLYPIGALIAFIIVFVGFFVCKKLFYDKRKDASTD
jgi:hypothetical protein